MTDRLPPSTLRLGLPSGSMQQSTIDLFGRAGYKVSVDSRSVFPKIDDEKMSAVLFRSQEVSRYVVDGIIEQEAIGAAGPGERRGGARRRADAREIQVEQCTGTR